MDPVRQDCWGIPIPHIRCKMGAEEQKLLKCQEIEAAFPETVKAAGDQTEFPGSPKGIPDWGGGDAPETGQRRHVGIGDRLVHKWQIAMMRKHPMLVL